MNKPGCSGPELQSDISLADAGKPEANYIMPPIPPMSPPMPPDSPLGISAN